MREPLIPRSPDAGSVIEAGAADAPIADVPATEEEGSTLTWCESPTGGKGHQFCSDFDEGPILSVWTGIDSIGLGSIVGTDTLVWHSPPASLEASIPGNTGAAERARVMKTLKAPSSSIRVQFDLHLETTSAATPVRAPGRAVEFSTFAVSACLTKNCFAVCQAVPYDAGLGVTNVAIDSSTEVAPLGTWTTVVLEIRLVESGHDTASLTVAGQTVLDALPLQQNVSGASKLFVGVDTVMGTTPASAHIDNVTVDVD